MLGSKRFTEMKWLFSLMFCLSASAQLPVIPYPVPSGASRWWPTNAAGGINSLIAWGELTPINGTFHGSTFPAGDNIDVTKWTNFASGTGWPNPGFAWNADQTLHPTNFVSGGGGNGTSPRLNFKETVAGDHRLTSGALFPAEPYTVVMVANCNNAASTPGGLFWDGSGGLRIDFVSATLRMRGTSTVTGPTTIGTGYYIITAIFNGASSRIDTNGVTYVSGNDGGNASASTAFFGQFQIFDGNISRFWGWTNVLSAGDLLSAVRQCGQDFGIVTP